MPIVFVHGVANRKGAGYEASWAHTKDFLRRYIAPVTSRSPDKEFIEDAYWGDVGDFPLGRGEPSTFAHPETGRDGIGS